MDGLIFNDEAAIAGRPGAVPDDQHRRADDHAFGTDEQKKFFLPRIAAGELHFSIGYSEPGAGTDLAALRTTAVRDGDDYVINGQKMWTSLIAYADYVWLAVRTDPDAKKHRGHLDAHRADRRAEGFSWTPVHTMAGVDTSATYYQDVRVPTTSLVGEENGGWKLITNQLNHERVALVSAQPIFTALDGVREWAQNTKDAHGKRLIDSEWVQLNLARVHAKAEVLKLINWEIASTDDAAPSPADASAAKVYGTELATEAYRLLMEVLGTAATLRTGLARRAAARAHRAHAPVLPDPHLRRRHQRDPARHHRHGRARPAPSQPVRNATTHMDFSTTRSIRRPRRPGPHHHRIGVHARAPAGARRARRTLRPRPVDQAHRRRRAVRPRRRRRWAAAVSACWSRLPCWRRSAASWPPCPTWSPRCWPPGALAKFGSAALQQDWAAPAVSGAKILTVALAGEMGEGPVQAQAATVPGYRLTGTRTRSPTDRSPTPSWCPPKPIPGTRCSSSPPDDPGVTVTSLNTTGHGSVGHLDLPGAERRRRPRRRRCREATSWTGSHPPARWAARAFQLGVLERALELTAQYAREREQFDRPIGSFQAVSPAARRRLHRRQGRCG